MNYSQYYSAVKYIESLSRIGSRGNYMVDRSNPEIYLKRMRHFLELIGNPDRSYKIIHITGTSGKGSVTNMLHEIIYASGKRVGSFTSPFVTTTIEKFKVNDLYISPIDFVEIVEYLKPYIETIKENGPYGPISYFETCLAIAFVYFKKQKCEWVVLEVGLGGRYDASNVIEKPIVTAITNIDYDHTEILGNTLEKIAYDKAGIIKEGSIFFTTESRKKLINIFSKICKEKEVKLKTLRTSNDYYKNNVALATAIAKGVRIEGGCIARGISNARLQCRFEVMQREPTIVIDGAHNKAKIKSTISNLKKLKYKKLFLVVAMSQNKDHLSILKQLVPQADYLYITKFQNNFRKCAQPSEIVELSKPFLRNDAILKTNDDSLKCLDECLRLATKEDLILVTGSFFLAGEVRKKWISEEYILENRKPFK